MRSYLRSSHLSRRSVRLMLEELEWRHVPSLLGLQIELPLATVLPLASGPASTPVQAVTATPGTTAGTTSSSPSLNPVSITFTPSAQSTSSTPIVIVFTPVTAAPQGSTASGEGGAAASSAGAGASSASSSSAFHGGISQGSGTTFVFPTSFAPALGIQAAQAGSSNVLGGSVTGVNFELLGNLPSLLGPANAMQGTANTAGTVGQLMGAPYGGSVFGRLDLYTDRTPGLSAPFGLMHLRPEEREEPLPENPPAPPDDQWWISDPRADEQAFTLANMFLRERISAPATDLELLPDQSLPVDAPILDARFNGNRDDFLFSEDDVGVPADEDQPEEQSGLTPAVAILSCAVGAYWAPRFRSSRKVAAVPSAKESDR